MILSYYSSEEIIRHIRLYGLQKDGDWDGVTDFNQLSAELEKARKRGWRMDINRNHIVGLAVPVWKGNKVVASLGVFLPESRFNDASRSAMLPSLREAAESLREIFSQPT